MTPAEQRHARTIRHGRNRQRWRGPNGLRNRVLHRDQHLCRIRAAGCTGHATTVHLAPYRRGDHEAATIDDCLSACHHCHGVIDGRRSKGGVVSRTRHVATPDGLPSRAKPKLGNRFLTALGRR